MKRLISLSCLALLGIGLVLSVVQKVRAASPTYTTIDYPGALDTLATGINRVGAIVGDFRFTENGRILGFLLSGGTFTQIECPSAQFTRPTGINDNGDIVGYCETSDSKFHGFLLSGGVLTLIDFPGAVETSVRGNDNAGDMVGAYCAAQNTSKCLSAGNTHGFLLRGGAFTTIDFPGAVYTEAWRINDLGEMLGRYLKPDGTFHLFLVSNGTFSSIPDPPGAIETAFSITFLGGLNRYADIVSDYCNLAPCPAGTRSEFFKFAGSTHGFLLSGGVYTTIDFPGALNTDAFGINDIGEIVGVFFGQDGNEHGFLRTP
jgi:probable HAF family extracellular repeat protein